MVLVHGDTLSTLVAAIAARRAGRCVGHVESGLRSESIWQPFPEEILRRIVFRLSDVLYCPSSWAATNVAVLKKNIVITHGNTMIDTVRFALEKIDSRQRARVSDYALVTSHRFENIFNRKRLKKLVELVELLASRQAVRFVLHTPTEHQLRKERLLARLSENPKIEMVPRMPHFEFLTELAGASCVLSDGGSIQEETSYLGVPCFLLRDYTERNEGLGSNAMLGGLSTLRLAEFLENLEAFRKPPALTGASPSLAIAKDVKARTAR